MSEFWKTISSQRFRSILESTLPQIADNLQSIEKINIHLTEQCLIDLINGTRIYRPSAKVVIIPPEPSGKYKITKFK